MGLNYSGAPAESLKALQTRTRALAGSRDALLHGLASLDAADASLPHRVYQLALDSLIQGKGLGDAVLVGWRYIVSKAASPVAIEVACDPSAQRHQFSSIHQGPHVEETRARFDEAQNHPHVSAGSYELNLLRIPALRVVALWLRSQSGDADLLIPLAPSHPALQAGHAYTASELVALLKQPAIETSKFDVRPRSR